MSNYKIQSALKRLDSFFKVSFLIFVALTLFVMSSDGDISIKKVEAFAGVPPINNTCIVPTHGTQITTYGVPFGGEQTLQQVLTNSYGINTTTDDTGTEEWTVSADTLSVDFVSKYVNNISSKPEAFGYYTNGDLSSFHPLWKSSATHSAPVPVLAHGTPFVFSIPTVGVTSIGFAIDSQKGAAHTIFATDPSLNALSEDHAVVFNPSVNKYVLGFEDLPKKISDNDYQDVVVEINVTGCQYLATQCISGENLVNNGGFETPAVTTAQGWDIFDNGTIGLDWGVAWMPTVVGAPVLGKLEIQNSILGWFAKAGKQYAELDTDWDSKAPGKAASVMISQNIATIPGKTYNLKYSFAARPGTVAGDNIMDVMWDGAVATTSSASGIGHTTNTWRDYSMNFLATSNLTTLSFADKGTANSLGVFLDEVSLTCDACVTNTGYIESDDQTSVSGDSLVPAKILSDPHTAWTADVDGASTSAKWIWSDDPVNQEDTTVNTTKTFVRTFSVLGTPTSGQITLAADNFYKVTVNGDEIASEQTNHDNFSLTGQDIYDVTPALIAGTNTLTIEVTNLGVEKSNLASNPAGLLYSLIWASKDCSGGTGGGGGNPETSVIHIQKFVDGKIATTGTFNVDATLSWGAPNPGNFGGGLPQLTSGNSYTTQTVALTNSINTAILVEVSGGESDVVPFGGECKVGKYRLVGYSIGASFAAAESASITEIDTLVLTNNFSSDQYVIVWNELCPEDSGGGGGLKLATVTLCKLGDDAAPLPGWTLSLTATSPTPENVFSIETAVDTGCEIISDVPYGDYTVDEEPQNGWENVSGLGDVVVDQPDVTFTVVNTQTNPDGETGGVSGNNLRSTGGSRSGGGSSFAAAPGTDPSVLGASTEGVSGASDPAGQILGESIGFPNTGGGPLGGDNQNVSLAVLTLIVGALLLGTTNYAFLKNSRATNR